MTIGVFKVGGNLIVMVLGSVEDEQYFSTIYFMKSKFKNKLTNRHDLVVKMFAQVQHSMDIFHSEM
jgi:hypothetical protein